MKGFIEVPLKSFTGMERFALLSIATIAKVKPSTTETIILLTILNRQGGTYAVSTPLPYNKVKELIEEAL
jgi:hypothetical protein